MQCVRNYFPLLSKEIDRCKKIDSKNIDTNVNISSDKEEQKEIDNVLANLMEREVVYECRHAQRLKQMNDADFEKHIRIMLELKEKLGEKEETCNELEEVCKEIALFCQNDIEVLKKIISQNNKLIKEEKQRR